jgi:hypothetical protein
MKTIKLLFSISLLFAFRFVGAQVILPNVKHLHVYQENSKRSFDIWDTKKLSNQNDSDFYFSLFYGEILLVHGNKVYYQSGYIPSNQKDSFLYFDFDLKVNDSIFWGKRKLLYVVDSIKPIKLADNNYYLHWFLSLGKYEKMIKYGSLL